MKLTGKAAEKDMANALRRAEEQKRETLARAKEDSARRGKEPFDLDKLEQLCDTSHEGRLAPRAERLEEFQRQYYVYFPDVMTIEEFARKVEELNRW